MLKELEHCNKRIQALNLLFEKKEINAEYYHEKITKTSNRIKKLLDKMITESLEDQIFSW